MGLRAEVKVPPFDVDLYRGGAHVDLVEADTVTFVFTAPHKPYVSVVGEFNGWDVHAHSMAFDGQQRWWVTVPLTQPTRYQFYVEIDDLVNRARVGDPYARQVQWDNNGPNAYLDFSDPYRWQATDWRPPPLDEWVIYELCVRDLGGRRTSHADVYGTFASVRDRLPYLRDLGVNAIELLPVAQFPLNSAWGTNPSFFMAPERTYGTPRELKTLVDAAHGHGIAVVVDLVLNKGWQDHPYYLIYPPMLSPNGQPLTDWNPFFRHSWHGDEPSVSFDCYADLSLAYLRDVVRFWLQEYGVDGLRFDDAAELDFDPGQPRRPTFDPEHGIAALAREARSVDPEVVLIADYSVVAGTNPAKSTVLLVNQTEIDAVWCEVFPGVMSKVLSESGQWEREPLAEAIGGCLERGFRAGSQMVKFTANHRTTRPVHDIKFHKFYQVEPDPSMAGNYASTGDIAMRKARLGLLALFTSVGTPMILAGQEFAEDSPATIYFNPLNWKMLERTQNQTYLDFVRRLVRMRREHPALRAAHVQFNGDDFSDGRVVQFRRWDGDGEEMVIALNFYAKPRQVALALPRPGRWRELLTDETIQASDAAVTVTVPEWDGRVYVAESD